MQTNALAFHGYRHGIRIVKIGTFLLNIDDQFAQCIVLTSDTGHDSVTTTERIPEPSTFSKCLPATPASPPSDANFLANPRFTSKVSIFPRETTRG